MALFLWLLAPALAHALSFDDAQRIAEERAPQIAGRQRAVAAVRSSRIAAGALPDPKLVVGAENVPVSGSMAYSLDSDFMTMLKVGVMQDVPNSDKRSATERRAEADIFRTEAELRIERLSVRRDASLSWLTLYYLQQKQSLLDGLQGENRLFADSVRAQLAAGRGVAAHEVELLLCNKLQRLFHDPTQLADLLEIPHDHRETLEALQAGAGQLALAWENLPSTDRKILVQRIVTRMVILSTRVDLQFSWQGLADAVRVPTARNGQPDTLMLSLDAQFRRIGGETRLVLQGSVADPPPNQSDPVLLNALAQAHAWGELYRRDPTLPMAYFAARARVSESYATRILRLAYLAPDIVEAIVAGKQPRSLTLKRLLRGIPLCWAEQRERFGLRQA